MWKQCSPPSGRPDKGDEYNQTPKIGTCQAIIGLRKINEILEKYIIKKNEYVTRVPKLLNELIGTMFRSPRGT